MNELGGRTSNNHCCTQNSRQDQVCEVFSVPCGGDHHAMTLARHEDHYPVTHGHMEGGHALGRRLPHPPVRVSLPDPPPHLCHVQLTFEVLLQPQHHDLPVPDGNRSGAAWDVRFGCFWLGGAVAGCFAYTVGGLRVTGRRMGHTHTHTPGCSTIVRPAA